MRTKNILKNISFTIIVILITFSIAKAGDLFPAGTSISQTFYTLGDIYNKLIDNTSSANEGDHDLDSSGSPASTFYTLKDIYEAIPTIDADKMLTTADYMGVQGTIQTRTISNSTPVINTGYYAATDLTTIDTDLKASNILSGVNLFGIEGPYDTTNLIPANVKNGIAFGNRETGTMSPSQPLKTGQTECYGSGGKIMDCRGTGQDGEYQTGQAMDYTVIGETVIDNSTGLMWKKCSQGLRGDDCRDGSAYTYTFEDAITRCERDTTEGFTDWRLPNIKELLSIVNYGTSDPAIDTGIFPNTAVGGYWSSTSYFRSPSFAWNVHFKDGILGAIGKDESRYVRCVR
jgi:hypothetical protein